MGLLENGYGNNPYGLNYGGYGGRVAPLEQQQPSYGGGTITPPAPVAPATQPIVLNPIYGSGITVTNLTGGGLVLNPGYTNIFHNVDVPEPKTIVLPGYKGNPAPGLPTPTPTDAPDPGNGGTPANARDFLLDEIMKAMPKTIGSKGVLYTRDEINVPNVSADDARFILSLLLDPFSYMGELQKANVLLFQKEVIDHVIAGMEPKEAVLQSKGAIKDDIYLYNPDGSPIYDDKGKVITYANPTTTTAAKSKLPTWLIIGGLVLLVTSSKK